jgi:DNA polymerase I-like protein with 3'-5' exonuclease and polymerase domains
MNVASSRGYIKTILGRRRRFDMWIPPSKYDKDNPLKPLPYDEAIEAYGLPLKRAFVYRAGNALIQGSAADMMKQALLDIGEAGYTPYLTVHDEADTGVDNQKQSDELKDIMANAIKLLVPVKVDSFMKKNWGECHD